MNDTRRVEEYLSELGPRFYQQLVTIREFEQRVAELYMQTLIPGIAHVSIGQEAVAVGVCGALRRDDYITSTHRGHGHSLAKGASPDRMFAELLGKEEGFCHGKGGSMHIADPETGNLGANAIVGGSLAIAAGAALGAKRAGKGQVAVCFFGDGALNQGLLLESMNMASIWQLPVIYVCENNQYGEYTPTERVTAGNLVSRGEAFDIPSARVDGMDVMAVYRQTGALVERARRGAGPGFMVCDTYRFQGHGMSDADRPYRTREEEREWMKRDPIERFARLLTEKGHCPREELDAIEARVRSEIDAAVTWAQEAAWPATAEVTTHVYPE
ncbi:MAG: thiamine pyrophosphate-dependent dehydrogenase E1 component subunit alpha [Anaerolineae bacterium]|nr:thiamine pyrophosphate-dependent dehydrogenase E1 component subunit alpha [Anaerolineae bacterium]